MLKTERPLSSAASVHIHLFHLWWKLPQATNESCLCHVFSYMLSLSHTPAQVQIHDKDKSPFFLSPHSARSSVLLIIYSCQTLKNKSSCSSLYMTVHTSVCLLVSGCYAPSSTLPSTPESPHLNSVQIVSLYTKQTQTEKDKVSIHKLFST